MLHCLKEMRERAGLSQKALAEQLGVHLTSVSKWEAGEFPEKYEQKLTEILNCSKDELWHGDVAINIEQAKKQAKETLNKADKNFVKKTQSELIKSLKNIDNQETLDYICERLLLLGLETDIEYLFFYPLLDESISTTNKKKIIFTFISALNN